MAFWEKGHIPWNKGLNKKIVPQLANSGVKKGNIPWNKGKKCPEVGTRQMGENNPIWKGNEVKYPGLHSWMSRYKPKPVLCEICQKKAPRDLANISGEYKRDIKDYQYLCRSCHMKKDKVNVGRKFSEEHREKLKEAWERRKNDKIYLSGPLTSQ